MKIIFTHLRPDVWQYKVANALKKKGIKTTSISIKSFNKESFNNVFDEIISLDLPNLKPLTILKSLITRPISIIRFFYKVLTIKADAAIIEGPPLYLTSFFIRIFKNKFPRIFFSYDIISAVYSDPKEHMSKIEFLGEKYSFRNCDAIIDKNYIKELDLLPKYLMADTKPKLEFFGYPSTEWFMEYKPKEKLSYKDGEMNIVYAGTILDNPLVAFMSDIRDVLKNKIHIHIYPNDPLTEKEIVKITQDKKELKEYLHIYSPIPADKLSKEIYKYDFGFFYWDLSSDARPETIKYTVGLKRSTYLEAGLPIICKKSTLYTAKPIEDHYLGISLDNLSNLKKEIQKFDYKKSIKNIIKYRNETSIEKNINRLIEFVNELNKK